MALERRRLTQEVAAAIQQKIVQLDLRPGDRLPTHNELANDLSISIPSLREGLQVLASLGILRLEHGRGTLVGRPSVADYLESVDSQLLSRAYAPDECVAMLEAVIDPVVPDLIQLHQDRHLLLAALEEVEAATTAAAVGAAVRTYYARLVGVLRRPLVTDVVDLSLHVLLSGTRRLGRLAHESSDLLAALHSLARALHDADPDATRAALDAQQIALENTVRPKEVYVCATGSIGGSFYTVGLELSGAMRELSGSLVRAVPTAGGVENLRLLADGEADVALTQKNIALAAVRGDPPFERAMESIRVVGRTHSLDLWIVTDASLDIRDVRSLSGRRVSIGTRSGYTSRLSRRLLELYGDDEPDIHEVYMSISQATAALSRGEIDVLFYLTGGMGTAIARLSELNNLRLLSVDDHITDALCRTEPGVFPSTIVTDADGSEARTVRVDTLLVCREDLPAARAADLCDALFLAARSSDVLDPSLPNCDAPLYLHSGVRHEHKQLVTVDSSIHSRGTPAERNGAPWSRR